MDVRTALAPADWPRGRRVLATCIGAYFGVRFCQVVVGPVVPGIIATFDVSRGTVGLALTGMWVAYALVQLPSGVFADRYGERVVVLAALTITAAGTLGLAVAPAFAAMGVAVAAIGVGAGVYYNPATTLLARTTGAVGGAIGTHRIGGQVAGVVAPIGAAAVGLRYGWREVVLLGSACVALVNVAFVRGTRSIEPVRESGSLGELLDPRLLADLLTRPHTLMSTSMMGLVEFAGLAAMAFLPTLLIELHGFGDGDANLLFALFFAVAAVSQPLGGRLSDRYGRDGTVVALAGAGVLGYGGLAIGGSAAVAVIAVVLAGASMSATPVIQSRMLDGLTSDERGTGFGAFRTAYLLFGATGTAVVGAVADVASWKSAFGILGGLFGVVLLIAAASNPTEADRRPDTF